MFLAVCLWLIGVNVATYAAFAADKRAAIRGEWRIREDTLLGLALVGGSFGAVLGQTILRHKTRKEPFRTQLYFIIGLELAIVCALALPPVRQEIMSVIATVAKPEPAPQYQPAPFPSEDWNDF